MTIVGDTHGQFHDVCRMCVRAARVGGRVLAVPRSWAAPPPLPARTLCSPPCGRVLACRLQVAGEPSTGRLYCVNGDFVDRGAWGVETLALLAAWKLTLPAHVFLLRGNHESATCTLMYGFKQELVAKYGKAAWRSVYAACKRLFAALPLAARVGQHTLVLHGGLFRSQPQRKVGRSKRKRARGEGSQQGGGAAGRARAPPPTPNSRTCRRGRGQAGHPGRFEPSYQGRHGPQRPGRVAAGHRRAVERPCWRAGLPRELGAGCGHGVWPRRHRGAAQRGAAWQLRCLPLPLRARVPRGRRAARRAPQRFLADNGLRLILRSHEGPDAREGRDDMEPMAQGYTLDHDTPRGCGGGAHERRAPPAPLPPPLARTHPPPAPCPQAASS